MKPILNFFICFFFVQLGFSSQQPDSAALKQANVLLDSAYNILYSDQEICIALAEEIVQKYRDQKVTCIGAYNVMGNAYHLQGKYTQAYKNYKKALALSISAKAAHGEISTYVNLGYLYMDQSNFRLAKKNFFKGIRKSIQTRDSVNLGNLYNNIAVVYDYDGNPDSSLYFHLKSLELRKKLGNASKIASSLTNIGVIYYSKGEYKKSLQYHLEAYRTDSTNVSSLVYLNLSGSYLHERDYKRALFFGNMAMQKGAHALAKNLKVDLYSTMFRLHYHLQNYDTAFGFAQAALYLKDSVNNEEAKRIITEAEEKFESEKKDRAIRQLNRDKQTTQAIRSAENARHKVVVISVLVGLFLVIIFSFFLFKRYRESQQQKKIIEVQKHVVEEKQKEIIDSINYAKRLQQAILTPPEVIKKHLPDSFLYYRPKDIVAGDFYFFEITGNTLFIAAADCTGHGVPGAMVSVVCGNALTRSVREFKLTDPGKILDKTRELVLETFSKSESEVKDGMDIALCAIEFRISNSELNINSKSEISNSQIALQFAGANNPLLVYRSQTDEFITVNADKQPVGLHDRATSFTTHTVTLHKNDAFYLFTDGYPDQFGGDKGKKMKLTGMKNFLYSVRQKNMSQQEHDLAASFETWKGPLEQLDDVCVIGVRI